MKSQDYVYPIRINADLNNTLEKLCNRINRTKADTIRLSIETMGNLFLQKPEEIQTKELSKQS